jgi:hypothetical protein
VLQYSKLEMHVRNQHFSSLDQNITYAKNEAFSIQSLGPYSQ